MDRIICDVQSTNSFLGSCGKCPGVTNIIEQLEQNFEENFIENITYKQWVTTVKTSLQTLISTVDEFLQFLSNGLNTLLLHSFLLKNKKNDNRSKLMKNECIVICYFSENYAFIIQNSVQGIH